MFFLVLFVLGCLGGLLSGLLGIGGGIIMFPVLLHVPGLLGFAAFGIKAAAAITSVQSFFGALSGAVGHHRFRRVNISLVWYFGGSMAITALLGSVLSKSIHESVILVLFAIMAVAAALLMLLKKQVAGDGDDIVADDVEFSRPVSIFWGSLLGLMSGIVGQGGGFLFVPVMLYILHVPTRVAIGTALLVGIVSSMAVMLGRFGTLQVPYVETAAVVLGAIFGAQVGARFSQSVPRHLLRGLLAVVIVITAIRMVFDIYA